MKSIGKKLAGLAVAALPIGWVALGGLTNPEGVSTKIRSWDSQQSGADIRAMLAGNDDPDGGDPVANDVVVEAIGDAPAKNIGEAR